MDRRRSAYSYSSRMTTPNPYSYMQARSNSREPSVGRSSSVNASGTTPNTGNFRLHRTSVDRDFMVSLVPASPPSIPSSSVHSPHPSISLPQAVICRLPVPLGPPPYISL